MSSCLRLKWLWFIPVSLCLAAWPDVGIGAPVGPPQPPRLVIATFDDRGTLLWPNLFYQQLQGITPTHVFVASHGWNNTASEALASYQRIIATMSSVADSFNVRPAPYVPLVIGIHWPSSAFEDVGSSNRSAGEDPEHTLLTIFQTLPTYKSPETHSQDVLSMQRLLSLRPDQVTPDDTKIAADLFKKYSLRSDKPDDLAFLLEPLSNDRGAGLSFQNAFNVFTYWQMKERAGIVGRDGVRAMVSKLQERFPNASFHLSGHSFGCKVMLAAVASDTPLSRPADSLVLLQGAVSYQAMAARVADTGQEGGYRRALDRNRAVRGVIAATFSSNDSTLNIPYEVASRFAGQVGELERAVSRFSALGRVGDSDTPWVPMRPAGAPYNFTPGLWSINGTSFVLGHRVIYGPEVSWMIWSAALASTSQAGGPGANRSISEDRFVELSKAASDSAHAVADKLKPTDPNATDISAAAFTRTYFDTLKTLSSVAPTRVGPNDTSSVRSIDRDLPVARGLQGSINDRLLDHPPFAKNMQLWITGGEYEKDVLRASTDRIVGTGGIRTNGFSFVPAIGVRLKSEGARPTYRGTGVYFRKGFVLTAAHVIPKYFDPDTDEIVVDFKSDVNTVGPPVPKVALKVYSNSYNYITKENDIALLYLGNESPPVSSELIGFASDNDLRITGDQKIILTIVGYGSTDGSRTFDGRRQFGRVPLVPLPYPTAFASQYNVHTAYEIAAADPLTGVDTSFGDSGGPILFGSPGHMKLVGLTSRGLEAVPGRGGGCYVRPDKFQSWIDGRIQDATATAAAPEPAPGGAAASARRGN
jgi:hypothetical protein